jgi:hypothetical protein
MRQRAFKQARRETEEEGGGGGWRPHDRRGRRGPGLTGVAWNGRWEGAGDARSRETGEAGTPTVGPDHSGGR